MDLITILEAFPTQEHCIEYLELLRWKGMPECPHCESTHVQQRKETEFGRIGRYNCHDCHSCFKVTQGTLFHGIKIPLQKGFSPLLSWKPTQRKVRSVANSHAI